MPIRKADKADLRSRYVIYFEVGLLVALALGIVITKIDFRPDSGYAVVFQEQEVIELGEIIPTKHEYTAPAPPIPLIPIAAPADILLGEVDLDLDNSLEIESLPLAPPPPPSSPPPPPPPPLPSRFASGMGDYAEEMPRADVFAIFEEMPQMVGGIRSLMDKVIYPTDALQLGLEGRVIVQFIVDEMGNVVNPNVVHGVGGGLDEAALAAIRQVRFIPTRQRGVPVSVKMSLPIEFKLPMAAQ